MFELLYLVSEGIFVIFYFVNEIGGIVVVIGYFLEYVFEMEIDVFFLCVFGVEDFEEG